MKKREQLNIDSVFLLARRQIGDKTKIWDCTLYRFGHFGIIYPRPNHSSMFNLSSNLTDHFEELTKVLTNLGRYE
jgi:hypothetical protein